MPPIQHKLKMLFAVTLVFSITALSVAVVHNEDVNDTVAFVLTDHNGNKTTQEDLSDTPLLVLFGFTSCDDICPLGLVKLSNVLDELKSTGQENDITPVMITVDPERDSPEKMNNYMSNFHQNIVGLTGSRIALENAAAEFNAFMEKPPEITMSMHSMQSHKQNHKEAREMDHSTPIANSHNLPRINQHTSHFSEHGSTDFIENYQLTHSSQLYLVDTYSRVVEYISLHEEVEIIVDKLRKHLAKQEQTHS